jgi:lipid A 4'-phosphatase
MFDKTNILSLNEGRASFNYIKMVLSLIVCLLSFLLIIFPKIDITTSSFFYDSQKGFYLGKNFIFKFLYDTVPLVTKILCFICGIGILVNLIKHRSYQAFKSPLMYLLLAGILGPGLLVNTGFKDHFGRARPTQIIEFEGTKEYTQPFVMSNQCARNCSFTSGHAAMAFYFTAFAYLIPKYFYRIYSVGIFFGSIVGLARIAQGGHFLSDVFFSGLFILLLNHYIFNLYKKLVKK